MSNQSNQQQTGEGQGSSLFMGGVVLLLQIAIVVFVLTLLGDWLDRTLHTAPWFLAIGAALGLILVLFFRQRKASAYRRRERARRAGGSRVER